MLIGCARVSTNEEDLTVQRNGLAALGVDEQTSTSITGSLAPTALDQARKKQSLRAVLATPLA